MRYVYAPAVKQKYRPNVEFGSPANYRILVQGHVGSEWSDRLSGLRLSTSTSEDGSSRTELLGSLRDQAALSGVLATLHSLHFAILVVEALDAGTEGDERG